MSPDESPGTPLWRFAGRALTAVAIAGAAFLLWQLRDALMIAFGTVVVAVLLLALADLLRRVVPLSHRWAVTAAAVLLLVVVAAFAWLMGSQVRSQFGELGERLPLGIEEIESQLGIDLFGPGSANPAGQEPGQRAPSSADSGPEQAAGAGTDADQPEAGQGAGQDTGTGLARLWDWARSFGVPVINAAFGTFLVVMGGIFLALAPETYRRGAVMLFPPSQHARIDRTMRLMGESLHNWLVGVLIAMAIVGVLVGLGTWAIGLPTPFALGLFAALTEFVAVVGPFVGALPAVLLALTMGGSTVLWTILLYVGIQQVESNMIAPVVQGRMVHVPPAIILLAVVVFGGIFGILGVIFAAPLAVVTYVGVRELWVRDTLHEDTRVTGAVDGGG
jgi:predicted PurR-regulated permease PerM